MTSEQVDKYIATPLVVLFVIVMMLIIIGELLMGEQTRRAESLNQYQAWCQLTGNDKNITFEQFKTLHDGNLLK